ncbi:MAG: SAF domain-containing protein [Elusimicrobia bacterium]|nr:SAF domain-containing protein [Elusimicrobiota bacterium]
MKIEKIIFGAALLALAAGVVMLIIGILKKDYGPDQHTDIAVIAAARDIPEGKRLAAADFENRKVSVSEPDAILYTDSAKIAGSYFAKVSIPRGNQITRDMIGGGREYVTSSRALNPTSPGTRGYIADGSVPGILVFNAGDHYYSLVPVSPEEAQRMLLKEVTGK